jgi:DNA-directed RNA polymerase specialized sigma24 family protein
MVDTTVNWPPLDAIYDDEFGAFDPAIYAVAGGQWPAARRFAESTLGDAATGLRLMIKATAIVSRRQAELTGGIDNPAAFLMFTFKRLVLGELKKHNRRRALEGERQAELLPRMDETAAALDQKILIEQLYARMDGWMQKAFELRMLDYSYEEMAAELGMKANFIRSKYSKELERLRRQVEEESRRAEQRARGWPSS